MSAHHDVAYIVTSLIDYTLLLYCLAKVLKNYGCLVHNKHELHVHDQISHHGHHVITIMNEFMSHIYSLQSLFVLYIGICVL